MAENVQKRTLADAVAEKLSADKSQTLAVIDCFMELMMEHLKEGNTLEFRNFGVFKVKKYEARKGRNPKTGESVEIPARSKVSFRPGKVMKEMFTK